MKKLLPILSFIFLSLLSFVSLKPAQASTDTDIINPIVWKTKYAKFSSSNFYIRTGDQFFYGHPSISIHSDPGNDKTTLETFWTENGINMAFFVYFQKNLAGNWEIYDVRTYSGQKNTDWVYYYPQPNPISAPVGQRYFSSNQIFTPTDQTDAQIYCQDCTITAFNPTALNVSSYGYSLDFEIGIPQDETITVDTDPATAYAVNAVLYDSSGQIVTDQSDFSYRWQSDDPTIVEISSQPIDYGDGTCHAGVLAPCPPVNGQISGISPGVTRIQVEIIRNQDKITIASNEFDVKVISQKLTPPFQTPSISDPDIQDLKSEIGLIRKQIEDQQQELSGIKKLLNTILEFFTNFFTKSPQFR